MSLQKKLARLIRERLTIRTQIFIILLLLISLVIGLGYTYRSRILPKASVDFVGEEPRDGVIFRQVVYISGAVKKPGVYEFTSSMRVAEVIDLAGGFSEQVDQNYVNESLNLASLIEDEQHLFIPYQNQINGSSSKNQTGLINLNNAAQTELESLPGIGPSTATKIISNRPYGHVNDLLNVSGIGDAKLDAIRDLVYVE